MHRLILLSTFCIAALVAEQYGTSEPYGGEPSVYVQDEAVFDPNVKKVQDNQTAIVRLKQENSELRQDVEGLKSIIEGLNATVNEMRQSNMAKMSNPLPSSGADPQLIKNLGVMIDKINRDYVTKAELSRALGSRGKYVSSTASSSVRTSKPAQSKASSSSLGSASSSALYSRGVRLVSQHKYSMAKQRFDILRARGYKKAATYFYSGEVAYRQGKYSDAIGYYKISAGSDDKANYMPTLLLHTGISMEKTGQKTQAKNFFKAIVDAYPGSYSAKEAKKHL